MPRLTIDNHELEVPAGTTVLQAARALGLDIPSLCFNEHCAPSTSCMLCLVKLSQTGALLPSCATVVVDGMKVQSETEEIHDLRRAGIELLLSDHAGDCTAPCQRACPVHIDVPHLLTALAAGRLEEAVATLRNTVALSGVLARLCSQPCESACRRGRVDEPAAIRQVQQFVTEAGYQTAASQLPSCAAPSGKRVAIVGAGPTGLAAAYDLVRAGHACTLFDRNPQAGGTLCTETSEAELPRALLDAELAVIDNLGVQFALNNSIDSPNALADLREKYDAVLLAPGEVERNRSDCCGLPVDQACLSSDSMTRQTTLPGVFAAGSAVRPIRVLARALAEGQAVAHTIDQYLRGAPLIGIKAPFNVPGGQLTPDELAELASHADPRPRLAATGELTLEQVQAEAARCLHCECGKASTCKLRHYAALYGAKASRYRGPRRRIERRLDHSYVVYDPGKCIQCGLCIQVAQREREPLGLTFVGRGFDVRVDVPFNRSLTEALQRAASACIEVCPTGALAPREHTQLPALTAEQTDPTAS